MILDVYKVTFDSTTPRPHYALFLEGDGLSTDETGYLIQVLGDVQAGYVFDVFDGVRAEEVRGFCGKQLIGYVRGNWGVAAFVEACQGVPVPRVQMNEFGVKIDKSKPFYREGEWLEDVIVNLKDLSILLPL